MNDMNRKNMEKNENISSDFSSSTLFGERLNQSQTFHHFVTNYTAMLLNTVHVL